AHGCRQLARIRYVRHQNSRTNRYGIFLRNEPATGTSPLLSDSRRCESSHLPIPGGCGTRCAPESVDSGWTSSVAHHTYEIGTTRRLHGQAQSTSDRRKVAAISEATELPDGSQYQTRLVSALPAV